MQHKTPDKEYVDIIDMKYKIHDMRMSVNEDKKENELTKIMFNDALEDLKKYKSEKYKFIINAGNSFKNALFTLFNLVWKI